MTDASDSQAVAESTDSDKIDEAHYPPDDYLGADQYGTTQIEEETPESVEMRDSRIDHRRELKGPRPFEGALIEPDDPLGDDVTPELVGEEGDEDDLPSAEEAAMHSASADEVGGTSGPDGYDLDDE